MQYRRAVWETALGQVDQQVYGMLIYFLELHNYYIGRLIAKIKTYKKGENHAKNFRLHAKSNRQLQHD